MYVRWGRVGSVPRIKSSRTRSAAVFLGSPLHTPYNRLSLRMFALRASVPQVAQKIKRFVWNKMCEGLKPVRSPRRGRGKCAGGGGSTMGAAGGMPGSCEGALRRGGTAATGGAISSVWSGPCALPLLCAKGHTPTAPQAVASLVAWGDPLECSS